MKSNDKLRQQLDQAEARCAELCQKADALSFAIVHSLTDEQQVPFTKQFSELQDAIVARPSDAFILRKQAEAVESEAREWGEGEQCYSGRKPHKELIAAAQRLRTQADELENPQ